MRSNHPPVQGWCECPRCEIMENDPYEELEWQMALDDAEENKYDRFF